MITDRRQHRGCVILQPRFSQLCIFRTATQPNEHFRFDTEKTIHIFLVQLDGWGKSDGTDSNFYSSIVALNVARNSYTPRSDK